MVSLSIHIILDQVTIVNDDEFDTTNDNLVSLLTLLCFAEIDEEVQLLFLYLFLKLAQHWFGHYINKLEELIGRDLPRTKKGLCGPLGALPIVSRHADHGPGHQVV